MTISETAAQRLAAVMAEEGLSPGEWGVRFGLSTAGLTLRFTRETSGCQVFFGLPVVLEPGVAGPEVRIELSGDGPDAGLVLLS